MMLLQFKMFIRKLMPAFSTMAVLMLLVVVGCSSDSKSRKTGSVEKMMVDYTEIPLGVDSNSPLFSWQIAAPAGQRGYSQTDYQIVVVEDGGEEIWNSGVVSGDISLGIPYSGLGLKPSSKYNWTVTVTDSDGKKLSSTSWFETGLMSTDGVENWSDAEWIGGDEYVFNAASKPVFTIQYSMVINAGSTRAGFVFGAADPRLLDRNKNNYSIEGENYIKYELDITDPDAAKLNIYRVGYGPDSLLGAVNESLPIGSVDIPSSVINSTNANQSHTFRLVCPGNSVIAYIDGTLVDGQETTGWGGTTLSGRTLNPLNAIQDVPCYPRLNNIGFSVDASQLAVFSGLRVEEYGQPEAVVFSEEYNSGYNGIFSSHVDGSAVSVANGSLSIDGGSSGVMFYEDPSHTSCPMLRKGFTAGSGIKSARAYVCSRGIYELYINGEKAGSDWLAPGSDDFNRHITYQTYDLTDLIVSGENAVGAVLSSGWFSDQMTYTLTNYNYFGARQSVKIKLLINYESGASDIIVSKEGDWKYYGDGPVTYASLFSGENYDARKEAAISGWSEAGFDDSAWGESVLVGSTADPEIVSQIGNAVKEIEVISARSYTEPRPGVYVYDMGVNMVGVPRVTLQGDAGTKVVFRTAEITYPDLSEYQDMNGESMVGMILTENLRAALSTDTYIMKGGLSGETYNPRFTFHGYRYLEITGIDSPLPVSDVQGIVLSSVDSLTGNYECSNPDVNQLYRNILRSQKGNFLSIPTDCPQRDERMGWSGDAQVFARTATFNANVDQFFRHYIRILRDDQNNMYPSYAPSYGSSFSLGLAWSAAGVIIPWELYQQYNDIQLIRSHYSSMKTFIDYLGANVKPGTEYMTGQTGMLGDHLSYVSTDTEMLGEAIYGFMVNCMSKMAGAMGESSDAEIYAALFNNIKSEWNELYVTDAHITRAYDGTVQDTQASYSLPLSYGMFSDEHATAAAGRLAEVSEDIGYIVTTGFIGTGPLCPALSAYGYDDTAYRLLESTDYPSWLYPVINGATSIWERWNSYTVEDGFGGNNGMNSFNHYSLGAIGAWMYNYSLGIRRDEDSPGFKHFILQPKFGGDMTYAKGHYDSMYGTIESAWELDGTDFKYNVSVPANTSATLYLPALSQDDVKESGRSLSKTEGLAVKGFENGCVVIELESGNYEFVSEVE